MEYTGAMGQFVLFGSIRITTLIIIIAFIYSCGQKICILPNPVVSTVVSTFDRTKMGIINDIDLRKKR